MQSKKTGPKSDLEKGRMNSDKDMVGMKNRASMYGMINDKEEKCSKKNDCLLNKQDACMEPTLR